MRRASGGPVRLPPMAPGMRIGLYGGSFDPPHPGHRHVALAALRRLALDRVWWLVTPGNPLKDVSGLSPLAERMEATGSVARHPRMNVTAPEAPGPAAYTIDTLRWLVRRAPDVRFVWIMGADSLAGFHRWQCWREIAALVPIAVIERPGWTEAATASRAAVALRRARLPEASSRRGPRHSPPAWVLLHGPRSNLSSTRLRQANPGARARSPTSAPPS